MSWDRFEYTEKAKCKCGKGNVIRNLYREDDDWNRIRFGCINEIINCPECSEKFHIECYTNCYERFFLVPNDISFPTVKHQRAFVFSAFDEEVVSRYSVSEIIDAVQDMKCNKYSTKLELNISKTIVSLYKRRYKKQSLNLIVPILEIIIQTYDQYEWTPSKISEYRNREKKDIEENKIEIQKAISQSFELKFERN